MMSIPPTPTSISSNSTSTSRSSLLRYYVDHLQDQQELVRVRTILAEKESENAALKQALLEWQTKADTYQDMHQTLRRRLWSLEADLETMKKSHAKRADGDAALIASLAQENEALKKTAAAATAAIHHPQPPFSRHNDSRHSDTTDINDPCIHAEEAYKTAMLQVASGRKKSESLILGIHDMVRAIEEELACLETPPPSSKEACPDDVNNDLIKPPTPPEDKQLSCRVSKTETPQRPPATRTMDASPPTVGVTTPQRPADMPRQRSHSMIQNPSCVIPTTRRNTTVLSTAEANASSTRLMMHCQKQPDPRRRRSAFLGNPFTSQQQQQQQPTTTLSEQWKISSRRS